MLWLVGGDGWMEGWGCVEVYPIDVREVPR